MEKVVLEDSVFITQTKEKIRNILKQSTASYSGKFPISALQIQITKKLSEVMPVLFAVCKQNSLEEVSHIDFTVEEDLKNENEIFINPHNLFTALLLSEHYVPYKLLENKEEWYMEDGTIIFKNNQTYFKHNKTVLYQIKLNMISK